VLKLGRYAISLQNLDKGRVSIDEVSKPRPRDRSGEAGGWEADVARDFASERYKFILQQINAINENVYRFLAIYQALMTTLAGAEVALFLGYRRWGLAESLTRKGLLALLALETAVAYFTVLMIVVGTLAWLDYRNEECDLSDRMVGVGFRSRPNRRNFLRWYETYIVLFIVLSVVLVWALSLVLIVPNVK
jgi:hypothetical protein